MRAEPRAFATKEKGERRVTRTLSLLPILSLLVVLLEHRRRRIAQLNLALLVAHDNLRRVGQDVDVGDAAAARLA